MEAYERTIVAPSGRTVAFFDRGPRDGHPVVYLHGMPGSRHEQLLIPDDFVTARRLRIISVDRPGWGGTDPLEGNRTARSADALTVCDALGIDSFALMAFSTGGSYGIALAAAAPSRVELLLLASAQMPYDDEAFLDRLLPDQRSLLPALRGGRTDGLVEAIELYRQHVLADPIAALEPSLVDVSERERELLENGWFKTTLRDEIVLGLSQGSDGLVEDLLLWPQPFDFDVSAVACPVRAIHGMEDNWEPMENLRRFLPLFDDAQLIALEGMNHLGPHTDPDVILDLLS